MLSWVEIEKSFITPGLGLSKQRKMSDCLSKRQSGLFCSRHTIIMLLTAARSNERKSGMGHITISVDMGQTILS